MATVRARWMSSRVQHGLQGFRVVVVTGPRQAGKTTLVRQVLGGSGTFQRLDSEEVRQSALDDPAGFAQYGPTPRAIDEIQLGGDALVRAIKAQVDDDRAKGQYLLNGSTDFLTVPGLSESLAGRAVFYDLWPFSQGELEGRQEDFLGAVFNRPESLRDTPPAAGSIDEYMQRVCHGGYPEAIESDTVSRGEWFDALVRTITQRDISDLLDVRRADQIPRLLRLLVARSSSELVIASITNDSELSREAVEDYVGYLEMTYLIRRTPAWSRNFTTRAKRHSKAHPTDTGLAAHLLGVDPTGLTRPDDARRGPLVEAFVVNELRKQLGWSTQRAALFYFRDRHGREIDVILETPDGRVVGIEVKASLTVIQKDFTHLRWLRDKLGHEFIHGVVLYLGTMPLPFGDRLTALPLAALWRTTPEG